MEEQKHIDSRGEADGGDPNAHRYVPSTLPIGQSPGMMSMMFIAAAVLIVPTLLMLLAISAGNFSITCQRFDRYSGECRLHDYKGLFGRILPTTTTLPLADIQYVDIEARPGNPGPVYGLRLHTRTGLVSVGTESDLAVIQKCASQINTFLQDSSIAELEVASPGSDLDYPIYAMAGCFVLSGLIIGSGGIYSLATYFLSSPQRRRSIAEIPADERPSLVFLPRSIHKPRPEPSLYEILRRDVQTYYFCLIMIIAWSGVVLIKYKLIPQTWGRDPDELARLVTFWVSIAIPLTLIFAPLVLRRLFLIKRILAEGADVTGLLVRIPNSNWAKLTIAYSYDGCCFETTQVLRSDLPSSIGWYRVGDQIDLLVDQEDPRRALLRDLWRDGKTF